MAAADDDDDDDDDDDGDDDDCVSSSRLFSFSRGAAVSASCTRVRVQWSGRRSLCTASKKETGQ